MIKALVHELRQAWWTWVRSQHKPDPDVDCGGKPPYVVCTADGHPWPCDAWVGADGRLTTARPVR
jgi:hypothetical protein